MPKTSPEVIRKAIMAENKLASARDLHCILMQWVAFFEGMRHEEPARLPKSTSLPELLRAICMVEDADLGEVIPTYAQTFRVWLHHHIRPGQAGQAEQFCKDLDAAQITLDLWRRKTEGRR